MTVWDDPEFLAAAKRRFLSGESPSRIAKDLGMSRNKLNAKMERLGLKRPALSTGKGGFVMPPMRTDLNPVDKLADSARKNAVARATTPDNPVREKVILLEDLRSDQCRFPLGDPLKPYFSYCGKKRANEKVSYCAAHQERSYQAVPLRRLRA